MFGGHVGLPRRCFSAGEFCSAPLQDFLRRQTAEATALNACRNSALCYDEGMKKGVYAVIVIVLALVAAVVWYMRGRAPAPPAEQAPEGVAVTPAEQLGADILRKAQSPLKDELPTANPFTQAETNPFVDVYKNPFSK